jgi:hypothetical protein
MTLFLSLFSGSKRDKADFLTSRLESYFRVLALGLAKQNMLRLWFLNINGDPVGATFTLNLNRPFTSIIMDMILLIKN